MHDLYEKITHTSGNNLPLKIYRISGVYLHWHNEYEFLLVENGSASCILNGETVTLDENSALLLQSGTMHSIQGTAGSKITAIVVSPDLWTNKIDKRLFDGDITYQRRFANTDKTDAEIIDLLKTVVKIYDEGVHKCEFVLKSKFTKLFEILITNGRFSDTLYESKKQPREFRNMINHIHEHYTDDLSLNTLAKLSFYSPTYIIRLFKKYTNMTPGEYIIQYRLSIAENKLLNSSESNLDISLLCGFNSESYFIHAFKKRYGTTPQSYRRKNARSMCQKTP